MVMHDEEESNIGSRWDAESAECILESKAKTGKEITRAVIGVTSTFDVNVSRLEAEPIPGL